MQNGEPTNYDILEAINAESSANEKRFRSLEKEITGLKNDVTGLKNDVTGLKTCIIRIEATMVTKEYLDDKLADLRGDMISVIRKEDRRLTSLIQMLAQKNVLNEKEVVALDALQPLISYDNPSAA